MPNIGDSERKTQTRVVKFFRDKLHYTYLGNLHDSENRNIMQERLHAWLLKQGYSEKLVANAVDALVKTSTNLQQGLYHANKEVYSLLKYGAKVKESVEQSPKTVYFIDFEDVSKNDFYIAEEVTIVSNNTKRPDVVIYVNGIALAVIELKKSSVSVSNGIRQNLTNQKSNFIEDFFTTIQFCMAGNDSEGLRYGTLLTPEKHYLEWKDDGFTEHQTERDIVDIEAEEYCERIPGKLEKQLFALLYKKRFLDLIHNFVIFDKGIKKVCRYNQYYAIKRAQHRLTDKKRGGIVWHTQGSGKSLTMVWFSKWILENNPNARVLVVTDREELDEQIEKNYKGVDENIVRTKSGKELLERLNAFDDRLLCSLVHKFGKRGSDSSETDYEKYIEDLKNALPKDFSAKGDIVVFVDECHRTQSGKLHAAMKAILPDAIFIGFTGTPLLKKDKKTSLETFGGYIHTYKFNEGVRDGVVLDLRYEARDVPQGMTSQDRIDAWFEAKTVGLAPRAKAKLKAYWGNLQKIFSSRSRLEQIANDTLLDFIISQEDKLKSEQKGEQESAAETIENNIRKKVVERMVINPAYYAKMSEILEQLILDRRRGVIAYGQLLDTYMELAKNVAKPEENIKYPENIRSNGALRALYDNCGEDEATALKLHKAIVKARLDGFRNNPVKANKIKRALYQLLNDDSEVERIYQIVVEQEEY